MIIQKRKTFIIYLLASGYFALQGGSYAGTDVAPKPLATEFQVRIISEGPIDLAPDHIPDHNPPSTVADEVSFGATTDLQPQAPPEISSADVMQALQNRFRDFPIASGDTIHFGLKISKEFSSYQHQVVDLAKDSDAQHNTRLMMLEIMRQNWANPTAQAGLAAVFDQEPLSSPVAAYAALHLAQPTQDTLGIGNRIKENYDQIDTTVRPLYLTVLARLHNVDSLPLVQERFKHSRDPSELIAAAEALGRLAEQGHLTIVEDLFNAAGEFGQAGHPSPLGPSGEVLAMRATEALGRINGQESVDRLLEVAANEELTTDVRMSAVQSLGRFSDISDAAADQLHVIDDAFQSSSRSSTDKRRFSMMIERALTSRPTVH